MPSRISKRSPSAQSASPPPYSSSVHAEDSENEEENDDTKDEEDKYQLSEPEADAPLRRGRSRKATSTLTCVSCTTYQLALI
jgi:hypothetical protein